MKGNETALGGCQAYGRGFPRTAFDRRCTVERSGWLLGLWIGLCAVPAAYALPTNADFSAGLSGWTTSGTVIDGGGYAVLLEATMQDSSSLYQDFVIDAGAIRLSFDYAFLTDGWFNQQALPDAFTARLLDPVTLMPILATTGRSDYFYHDARGESDSLVFAPIAVTRTPVSDPLRPDWYTISLDVSSLTAGTSVRLMFELLGGDNGQQTLAAVDGVSLGFREEPIIPEPLTVGLVAAALAALSYRYGRRETASPSQT